ncbi:MAG: hypothetical protein JXR61_11620 [Prolixibacteraceae bacterium]|nr:hypothetical protein [Prolixibacteraceae bacterium]
MRIAIIDLGTNTCNLLIAETKPSVGFSILHQSKVLVKLGDSRIINNKISAESTERAVQSFLTHIKIIESFQVDRIQAIATSAVREASNKIAFLEEISNNTGIVVKIVSGEKEAEMIFNGVLLAVNEFEQPTAILDIGGGSNEIILAENKEMIWKESQPAGMARVINRFNLSDPVQPNEIKQLQNFFSEVHKNAFRISKEFGVKTLVGCSGAFDTIADIIDQVNPGEKARITQQISVEDFHEVYQQIIQSTRKKRLQMKGMDMVRIDLIVPAVILIKQLISSIGITEIIQTDFALREGAFYEMVNKEL